MKITNKLHLLPNILSILRIFLTIIIIVLMFVKSDEVYFLAVVNLTSSVSKTFLSAGIIFIFACITDFLDGFLARKYNWISDFGKIWDSISDKVLINSILIGFAVLNLIPFYFVLIIIFRDFIVDGYRSFSAKNGIIVPANFFGKIKFVLQTIAVAMIFFVFNEKGSYQSNNVSYYLIQNLFIIISTIASVISGVIYVVNIQTEFKKIKSLK